MKENPKRALAELRMGMTETLADAEAVPDVAEMVAVPAATPVANPELLMVSTSELLLLQLTVAPDIVWPFWSLTVAVNWWVVHCGSDLLPVLMG